MQICTLQSSMLYTDMFCEFDKCHHIKQQWVKKDGNWVSEDVSYIRQWNSKKKKWIPEYLLQQIQRGGFVVGAFENVRIIGFASIDGAMSGSFNQYVNLTMMFVSSEYRGKGIGSKLFSAVCEKALGMGAKKIYISANPAVDTVAFYQKAGCLDSLEVISEFVDQPEDRPMEFVLLHT
jgi:GNAT superfamily N-acetyltransferase